MLLIDGVKYELWTPPNEGELENQVNEHAQGIFGENSIYFDRKQRLKSASGVVSIPDGYVIILGTEPQWHIVEVELSSHPPYEHIVPQVDKFINAVDYKNTQSEIVEVLDSAINNDELLRVKTRQAIGQDKDIYKFLSVLVAKPPTITIIIEKNTEQLREALKKYTQKRVVEFQTFRRAGAETVHAHLFEPLYKPTIPTEIQPLSERVRRENGKEPIEIELQDSSVKRRYIVIREEFKDLFPDSTKEVEFETDKGTIRTELYFRRRGSKIRGRYLRRGVSKWFKAHPELKVGDKIRIMVIETMKKYRLEIVK